MNGNQEMKRPVSIRATEDTLEITCNVECQSSRRICMYAVTTSRVQCPPSACPPAQYSFEETHTTRCWNFVRCMSDTTQPEVTCADARIKPCFAPGERVVLHDDLHDFVDTNMLLPAGIEGEVVSEEEDDEFMVRFTVTTIVRGTQITLAGEKQHEDTYSKRPVRPRDTYPIPHPQGRAR